MAFSARKNAEKATTVVGKMPPEAEKELADAPEGLVDWLTGGKTLRQLAWRANRKPRGYPRV
jgi:hypothetical protein